MIFQLKDVRRGREAPTGAFSGNSFAARRTIPLLCVVTACIGLNVTYCLGCLRQEENRYLSCPPHIARDFEPALTDLFGYTLGNYALGYYASPEMVYGLPDTLPPEIAIGRMPEAIPGNTRFSGGPTTDNVADLIAAAGNNERQA